MKLGDKNRADIQLNPQKSHLGQPGYTAPQIRHCGQLTTSDY